tara:strand:+ start:5414 stop:5761 length:348 start_codon:yes stop_codon:yes gene_type:complete
VEAGNSLGFFILQDAAGLASTVSDTDTFGFVNGIGEAAKVSDGSDLYLQLNGSTEDLKIFHSYSESLNSDGVQHALSGVNAGGKSITIGFEDQTGGGDRDYGDVAFMVETLNGSL